MPENGQFNITFNIENGGSVTAAATHGENLLALARKVNVAIDAPCSGNGSCGKCRVRVTDGAVASPETRHVEEDEFADGWRLACASTVTRDAEVFVPDVASAYRSRLRVTDMSSPEEQRVFAELKVALTGAGLTHDSGFRTLSVTLDAPTLDDTMPDDERFVRAIPDGAELPYHVLRSLPDTLRGNGFSAHAVMRGAKICAVTADAEPVCGLAIDIGTTTVSALLVDLSDGRIIAKGSSGNGQIRFGADVINRIIEQQKQSGVARLQRAVIEETLLPVLRHLCAESGIAPQRIFRAVVAGNTTMEHLLLGINANYLRTEPYIPAFFLAPPVPATELGIALADGAEITLAPNIGSYVGGDVTGGCLASMMWDKPELSLLVDLGTNGEIVFGNNEFLMACACSAGPAFEGGDIKCGMRATDGAIEACTIDAETMVPAVTVFGGEKPVGICGSGIIDIIAELFRCGIIDGRGKFAREGDRVIRDEVYGGARYVLAFADESATGREVFLDETDIDNFIRTKGAIFSAIMTLTESLGFTPLDLERIYVAGGIGSGIDIQNAIRIGMFPALPEERYAYIGNSSLNGAYAVLTSRAAEEKLTELAKSITYVELSTYAGYMDQFVAACFLPHTDAALFAGGE